MPEGAPPDEHLRVARPGTHGGAQGEQGPPEQVAQGEREEGRAQREAEADGQEPERVVGDREVGGQPQPEEVAAPAVPLRERDVLDGVRFERAHPIAIARGCHAPRSLPTRVRRPDRIGSSQIARRAATAAVNGAPRGHQWDAQVTTVSKMSRE
jgi:hypothetical protein